MAWVTQAEYARHRGVSRQSVSKAVKAGRVKTNEQGLIDPDAADIAWAGASSPTVAPASLRGTAAPPDSEPEPPRGGGQAAVTFATSRAVRENYLARMAKLEYEEKAGQLVRRDLVRRATFEQHRKVRELLLTVPDRVTPLVATTQDENTRVYQVLRDEVLRICGELNGEFSGGRRGLNAGAGPAEQRGGGGVPTAA